MTHQELLISLANDLYAGRPFPLKRQPIYEPLVDRFERWVDEQSDRYWRSNPVRWTGPFWLKALRKVRRQPLYRRWIYGSYF